MTLFTGTVNDDVLIGMSSDDEFVTSAGNDTIDGGLGLDWLNFSLAGHGVYMELYFGTVSDDGLGGHDIVSNVENVIGSQYADFIVGNDTTGGPAGYNDILIGLGGDDLIYARAGDDYLRGDAGNDYLNGGDGIDGVYYYAAADWAWIDLAAGTAFRDGDGGVDTIGAVENVQGTDFNDYILGDSGNNKLDGYEGNDDIWGRGGDNTLIGGDGIDTAWYTGAPSAIMANLAVGTASNGFGGVDTFAEIENLHGSAYADGLIGNAGHNDINGDGGNDYIAGQGGDDVLTGMSGADTFHFAAGDGVDNVIDYDPAVDYLEFDHTLYTSISDVLAHAVEVEGSAKLTNAGSVIVVDGVSLATLSAHTDHFLFV